MLSITGGGIVVVVVVDVVVVVVVLTGTADKNAVFWYFSFINSMHWTAPQLSSVWSIALVIWTDSIARTSSG